MLQCRVARTTGNVIVEDGARKRVAVISPKGEVLYYNRESGYTKQDALRAARWHIQS